MNTPRAAPAELEWLIAPIGEDGTLALIEARGGTRVYVPARPDAGCELARIIGLPAAQALALHFGGEHIRVPLARGKWAGAWRARIYHARGLSYPAIARRLGVVENTVRVMLRQRTEDAQLALPMPQRARA